MPPSESLSDQPRYPAPSLAFGAETYAVLRDGRRVVVVVDDRSTGTPQGTFADGPKWGMR